MRVEIQEHPGLVVFVHQFPEILVLHYQVPDVNEISRQNLFYVLIHKVLYIKYRWLIMGRSEVTTIQLDKSVVEALKRVKRYPRETYNEVILNLIRNEEETREFSIFVQKAQEAKMKELWEEGDYSGWERA